MKVGVGYFEEQMSKRGIKFTKYSYKIFGVDVRVYVEELGIFSITLKRSSKLNGHSWLLVGQSLTHDEKIPTPPQKF